MGPEPFATPLRDMLTILAWCAAGLVLVFLVLALVRLWGWKTQRRGGSCGGIDLDDLRRQLIAGEISHEEYEAVRETIAGVPGKKTEAPPPADAGEPEDEPPADAPDDEPTGEDDTDDDAGDDGPERSHPDGETQ
jgi:hypothetical protein